LTPSRPACDIFCRVVDNFGDIGVSWRLARQLSHERDLPVRLVVDDLSSFQKLVPGVQVDRREQMVEGVSVLEWREPLLQFLPPADLVIETFGCELPPAYIAEMASNKPAPVWINLEYLSAELWAGEHHLLPSPHPVYPLTKHFFFPGFTPETGGLIRERDVAGANFNQAKNENPHEFKIFLFSYAAAPVDALLAALDRMNAPVRCTIAHVDPAAKVESRRASQGKNALKSATVLEFVSFCPQIAFDDLLAAHDILFVRGEDSLVRAIWAGKPFVWQIYPQAEGAHLVKLQAFLDLYCDGLAPSANLAMRELWRAWNAADSSAIGFAWEAFLAELPNLREHAVRWSSEQLKMPDLASNLLSFYRKTAKI